MKLLNKHAIFEKNPIILLVGILVMISVGGLVEIVPLFYLENTIEKVEGMRPYTPLELAGRNVYIREGCYTCHSQMIRSTRDEVERYGHYSLAAESMYDHPQLWGSKRNGPDLARVGNKYSDEWHKEHLIKPSSVVPETIMPGYPFLATAPLKYKLIANDLKVNQMIGVPYTDEMVENAEADLKAQLDEFSDGYDAFIERYPNAQVRDFDGDPSQITEMDALIAYLQMLGTLVDFSIYNDNENNR
ncbi:cytochrome-c oxidase, cbb3-type subunit II [Pseudemcibacter aquimaris]|uniref:cytochrome-c oxidase, cbb3-type subunit II n=1 Tax=Pseudemcibacter aquimaris TaxID=2857064 RepID=UPI00201286B0|nr:cytochrome-c oxidase, cbb3-type subunit II [Pseudemcibacter aquimaris]MCC3862276.1 cytochrome-c oxidase, cbb3-type subunit II [Pseudemcibacter aquimaris]WDU59026.1 cytochrome-c oxidase, cbb3-type subunit II [Pseudemcibacter aquimaris]